MVKPPPTLLMTGTVWGCVEAKPATRAFGCFVRLRRGERSETETLPMRSEGSPRLITLGSDAMMRLGEDAGEADRLCSDVRVLTGGSGPPLDT